MIRKTVHHYIENISLRKKLTISFALLVSIPTLVLGVFSFSISRNNLKKQTVMAMKSNLEQMIVDMNGRLQRETDFTKFLAYNMDFREILEANAYNHVKLAQAMNETVEPMLWYFLTSDVNMKNIQIITPYVLQEVGSFLKPHFDFKEKNWYRYHQSHFNTVWSVEENRLFATRSILDANSIGKTIGVLRTEFHLNRLIKPISESSYLDNGILLTDERGEIVYSRATANPSLEQLVIDKIHKGEVDKFLETEEYILMHGNIEISNWRIYYYIDKVHIIGQLSAIISSTLIVVGICMVIVIIFIGILSRKLTVRILALKDKAEEIASGKLDEPLFSESKDEIGIVTNSLAQMTTRLNELINHVYKIEIDKKVAELQALQAMINPHFLYNCLSSIKWKAIKMGADDISDITGLVAKFYRTSLNQGKQITLVENEIENIKAYIDIQKLTHENSFEVEYRINEACMTYSMLNFLLQPIIENAIKHGIEHKMEIDQKGKIIMELIEEEENLVFNIYNNGPLIELRTLEELLNKSGQGYGIFNIQQRIALYYGDTCGIKVSISSEHFTCFSVKILKDVELIT